jgi:cobalt transporter subunit CbtB
MPLDFRCGRGSVIIATPGGIETVYGRWIAMAANETLQPSAYQAAVSRPDDAIRWPALVACTLGAVIVFGVGFAGPELIHNAAHDTRHSINFPCH